MCHVLPTYTQHSMPVRTIYLASDPNRVQYDYSRLSVKCPVSAGIYSHVQLGNGFACGLWLIYNFRRRPVRVLTFVEKIRRQQCDPIGLFLSIPRARMASGMSMNVQPFPACTQCWRVPRRGPRCRLLFPLFFPPVFMLCFFGNCNLNGKYNTRGDWNLWIPGTRLPRPA